MKNFANDFKAAAILATTENATRGLRLIERALNAEGIDADLVNPNTTEAQVELGGGRFLALDDGGSFWFRIVSVDEDGRNDLTGYDEAFDNAEDAAAWVAGN